MTYPRIVDTSGAATVTLPNCTRFIGLIQGHVLC